MRQMWDGPMAAAIGRAFSIVGGTLVGALAVATLLLPLVAHAEPSSVGEDRVIASATAVLHGHLAARTDSFRIEPRPLPAGTIGPEPSATLVARPLAAAAAPATRMRVWVDVHAPARDGGRFLRSIPVAFEVAATRAGWVAERDVPAGASIVTASGEGSLRAGRVDIALLRSEPAAAWPEGARLRRALRAGETLTASHLEPAPDVSRGDTVSLLLRGSPIFIETKAEALQDGHRGAAVWVRVAQATAPVRARVIDVATVEVVR